MHVADLFELDPQTHLKKNIQDTWLPIYKRVGRN